jgi:hypothetical protein
MPQPNLDIIIHNGNRLIQEEMSYNISSLKREHEILFFGLNNEQRLIYNSIMEAVTSDRGGIFLSTDMVELEKHIFIESFCLLLDQKVKLLSLLPLQALLLQLPGGRTAHSRFHIPINVNNDSTCDIMQRCCRHRRKNFFYSYLFTK